ncbi:MAG TPA: alpha/beta fold hydrolase [Pyrinomonadaceae bacterium]|nr:alpha/beta fold hydrolase [Pyrinomonadaceae bacterium]
MKAYFLLILVITLLGCNSGASNNPSNTVTANNTAANNSANSVATTIGAQTVAIDSPDGVKIVGSFFESARANSPAVLLLHQWQSDRHSYDDFAKRLQAKGFNVLSIDGRGFGESVKTVDGKPVAPDRTDATVKGMLGDVGAAFDFLSKQKNVDPSRVGIVGASYGSSLAIIYAADNPKVKAVALLSPGLNYFGNMATEPAVRKYGDRDLFVVASKGDTESAEAAENFEKIGNTRYGFMILPVGSLHGTEMFKYRDKTDGPPVVEDAVESFLMTRLGLAKANYK